MYSNCTAGGATPCVCIRRYTHIYKRTRQKLSNSLQLSKAEESEGARTTETSLKRCNGKPGYSQDLVPVLILQAYEGWGTARGLALTRAGGLTAQTVYANWVCIGDCQCLLDYA